MIIFSGWRTLAALVAAAVFVSLLDNGGPVLGALGLLASGVAVFFYGRSINAPRIATNLAGQTVQLRGHNRLFWIPLQYWGAAIAVGGVVALIAGQ